MKRVSILGSTGSIGTQTLDVISQHSDELCVAALAAGRNIKRLEEQMRQYHPCFVCVATEELANELRIATADLSIPVASGMDGLIEIAKMDNYDVLVTAIVGMMGIRPTVAAIENHKDIALANKETLVTAGHIIIPLAKKYGVQILPVDSEHSAIFQSLYGQREQGNKIDKILLTASGGPFRGKCLEELSHVTLKDALKHPNWSMGRKITVDSSTLVNKGLEVMEAKWLFDVDLDRIEVVVHPQSVIHSMVQYEDGAIIAQLGTPDMRLPIQYALLYPKRKPLKGDRLDFFQLGQMTFEKPDLETFAGLRLALEAMRKGGNMPTIFNAANEKAVAAFLREDIRFLDIADWIGKAMEHVAFCQDPSLEEVLGTEQEVYRYLDQM